MPTRWEIERGIRRSFLRPSIRLTALALLIQCDWETGVIPVRYSPSLNVIALWTGLHRSTVKRALRELERDGWVKRDRPAKPDQVRGVTTTYALFLPIALGAPGAEAGRTMRRELGAPGAEAGRTMRHKKEPDQEPDQPSGEGLISYVIEQVRQQTGRKLTKLDAARALERAIGGRQVRDTRAYVRACIARDPLDWLPSAGTPMPPTLAEYERHLAELREQEANE